MIYTSIWQPAFTNLIITVDPLSSNDPNPDLDVYASTTTMYPDSSNNIWKATNANAAGGLSKGGEGLEIGSTSTARTVYFVVRAYRGASHFVMRGNVTRNVGANEHDTTVCHPSYVNISQDIAWPKVRETLQRTALRVLAATNGNIYLRNFNFKYLSGTGGDKYCNSDPTCDWCMPHESVDPDYCGWQAGGMPGRVRIPRPYCPAYNDPAGFSLTLAHEAGHGELGLTGDFGPPVQGDEYSGTPSVAFCGHSVMNGPQNDAYRLCTGLNHCRDPGPGGVAPPTFNCGASGSMWSRIQAGPRASWYYNFHSGASDSAQVWKTFHDNYWAREKLVFFTFQ